MARRVSQLLEPIGDTPETSRLRNNILQISDHQSKVNQVKAARVRGLTSNVSPHEETKRKERGRRQTTSPCILSFHFEGG